VIWNFFLRQSIMLDKTGHGFKSLGGVGEIKERARSRVGADSFAHRAMWISPLGGRVETYPRFPSRIT